MWSLFRFNDILHHLNKVLNEQSKITIWQSSTQQLYKLTGRFVVIDEKKSTLVIEDEEFELNDHEVVYFHCEVPNIIFKREKFSLVANELTFKTPSELMLKEKRRVDRFLFKYQDFKDVRFFYYDESNDDKVELEDKKVHISFSVVDLSIAGLGCIGERREIAKLEVGSTIYIEQVSDQELDVHPLKAYIRSLDDYDVREGMVSSGVGTKQVRLGIEFDKAIDQVQYESVQSIIKRTQRKTKGLDIDGFNGLSEVEMLRVIKKAGEENPVLASEIIEQSENIDRLRYMTSEMKTIFWTEVNKDLLAQALRVASKELIYTLLSDVTDNIRTEFLEELDRPKSLSAISKAQRKICDFIHQREREGRFVLSATSYVKYV